jgi:hypothetical protein
LTLKEQRTMSLNAIKGTQSHDLVGVTGWIAISLLVLSSAANADSAAPSLSQEGMIVIEAEASSGSPEEEGKTLIIEAHLEDGQAAMDQTQPVRKKRIRILKSSDDIDHPKVQALIEKLSQGADVDAIEEDIELLGGESIELSDLDTHVFIRKGGPGDVRESFQPPGRPRSVAEGIFHLPMGDQPMRWHASKPRHPALSKEAAECILDRLSKVDTEAGAMLLRDACSAAHPSGSSD